MDNKPPYRMLRKLLKLSMKLSIPIISLSFLVPLFLNRSGDQSPGLLKNLMEMKTDLSALTNPISTQPQKASLGARPTKPSTAPPKREKKAKIYKWKDKNGVLHLSDQRNSNGPSEAMYFPQQEDKMSPPRSGVPAVAKSNENLNSQTERAKKNRLPFPMTVPYTQVEQLKKDAEEIKKKLEERYKEYARLLEME